MISEKKFRATPYVYYISKYSEESPRQHGGQREENEIHFDVGLSCFGALFGRILPDRGDGAPG